MEMSHWIHLSKVPDADLWDVVAARMARGVLTYINAKLRGETWSGTMAYMDRLCNGHQGPI